MVIYGAGGHSKVIIDSLKSLGIIVDYVFDDNFYSSHFCGIPVGSYSVQKLPDSLVLLGIGSNEVRSKLSSQITHRFGKVVHRNSYVASDVIIGEGSVVLLGACVNVGTVVGRHTIINTHAVLDHDCMLGDYVHIGPNCTLCGHVAVGAHSFLGAGVIVSPMVKIGANVKVGIGIKISKNVPDDTLVNDDWQ